MKSSTHFRLVIELIVLFFLMFMLWRMLGDKTDPSSLINVETTQSIAETTVETASDSTIVEGSDDRKSESFVSVGHWTLRRRREDTVLKIWQTSLNDDAEKDSRSIGRILNFAGYLEGRIPLLYRLPAASIQVMNGENLGSVLTTDNNYGESLTFVRKDDILQVQRAWFIISETAVGPLEVVFELRVPKGVAVNVDGALFTTGRNKFRWNLVSGIYNNPYFDCRSPIWNGEVEVSGWFAPKPSDCVVYCNGNFILDPDDFLALPVEVPENYSKTTPFYLKTDRETIGRLLDSSPEEPISVLVKGFSYYCEGPPTLSTTELMLPS